MKLTAVALGVVLYLLAAPYARRSGLAV